MLHLTPTEQELAAFWKLFNKLAYKDEESGTLSEEGKRWAAEAKTGSILRRLYNLAEQKPKRIFGKEDFSRVLEG